MRREFPSVNEGTPDRRSTRHILPPMSRRPSELHKSGRSLRSSQHTIKSEDVAVDQSLRKSRNSHSRRTSVKSRISSALRDIHSEEVRIPLQERFEELLDHEHQYADRPDDFHEKLQILLDHITDLLNRQRVEEVSKKATIASKVESAQRLTFFAWKMFQMALTLHVIFYGVVSIYPDITKFLVNPAGFLSDLSTLFTGAYFAIYVGGGYLLALLPSYIALSQRTFGWTLTALIGILATLSYHFAFTAYGLASFPPEDNLQVGPFVLYFMEGVPFILEVVALAMVINRWNVAHNRVVDISNSKKKKDKKTEKAGRDIVNTEDLVESRHAPALDDSGFARDALAIAVTAGGPDLDLELGRHGGSPNSHASRRRSRRSSVQSQQPHSRPNSSSNRRSNPEQGALRPEELS